MNFLKEFILLLKVRKKLWLMPIILVLLLLSMLIVLGEGTAVAPLIYTIF